jgi:predicted nucleic acid-binding protein
VGELLSILGRVFEVITLASIRGEEACVFELAVKEGSRIHDAAYLHCALRNKLVLVADDRRLMEKAKQYIETMSTRELVQKIDDAV